MKIEKQLELIREAVSVHLQTAALLQAINLFKAGKMVQGRAELSAITFETHSVSLNSIIWPFILWPDEADFSTRFGCFEQAIATLIQQADLFLTAVDATESAQIEAAQKFEQVLILLNTESGSVI